MKRASSKIWFPSHGKNAKKMDIFKKNNCFTFCHEQINKEIRKKDEDYAQRRCFCCCFYSGAEFDLIT